jgi:hypothetical protein
VVDTVVLRLLCCGFRRTGKAMGPVYQCWRRICREINVSFSPGSNITYFTFYIHLWLIYWFCITEFFVFSQALLKISNFRISKAWSRPPHHNQRREQKACKYITTVLYVFKLGANFSTGKIFYLSLDVGLLCFGGYFLSSDNFSLRLRIGIIIGAGIAQSI